MKIFHYLFLFPLLVALCQCTSITDTKARDISWEMQESKGGNVIEKLLVNKIPIYMRTTLKKPNSRIHCFIHNGKIALLMSDYDIGTPLGSGFTFDPAARSTVMTEDLNKDGKVDLVFIGDTVFGHYADNRYAPIPDAVIQGMRGQIDILKYISKTSSEQ